MRRIRVLIVDDAVVVRRMVSDVLSADSDLEVVGAAPNGRIALAKIPQLNPDLVTLDIEMPEMGGLAMLKELRKTYPKLPVIMFSTLTERGAAATLDALALGASDYVTKPANVGSVNLAIQRIKEELIPKIRALVPQAGAGTGSATQPGPRPVPPSPPLALQTAPWVQPVEVLALGVSTGGPNALAELVPALPRDLPVPILIVQHMPPMFTRLLAQRLTAQARLPVEEAVAGRTVEPGRAYLAPGDHHMVVARHGTAVHVHLHQGPPENSCRPAVDVLFRSVAEVFGAGALGVVLTGMGRDGLVGCERIREGGGHVLVQDEATSVVWGMPGFVAHAGLADAVLPLGELGPEIVRRVGAHGPPHLLHAAGGR